MNPNLSPTQFQNVQEQNLYEVQHQHTFYGHQDPKEPPKETRTKEGYLRGR